MKLLVTAAALLVLASAGAVDADGPEFRVVGRSLATIYIDAGRGRGLEVGDRVRVVSGPTTVAEMVIVAVDERAAACRVRFLTRPIGRGDRVVPVSRASHTPTRAASSPTRANGSTNGPAASSVETHPSKKTTPPLAAAPAEPVAVSPALSNGSPPPGAEETADAPAPVGSPPAGSPSVAGPTVRRPTPSPTASSSGAFQVKYRSASNAYLDAGRAEGLEVGDRLRVIAGIATIAELEVAYVAELSASCRVLSETRPVEAGDVARLVGRATRPREIESETAAREPSTTAAAAPLPAPEPEIAGASSRVRWGRVRGAASLGYFRTWDRTESALDYQQRTARLDLGLSDIGGQPLSFRVRARTRQDVRARTLSRRTPRQERTDRLYELALRYEPPAGRVAFEMGRIGVYRFLGLGYLDGVLLRTRPRPGVRIGAFGGRRVEIAGPGFDGIGGQYGAFVRLVPAGRFPRTGYDVLLAYARENADGEVSREYLSLESSFGNGRRWSLFQRAQLDLNRGWRQELTGKGHQLSNISLSANLRATPSSWAFVSYDGRRNYRYYRNRLVPEELFDDLLHQGLRAGWTFASPGGLGATAGFGMSLKEEDPRHPELNIANAYSFNAGLRHSNLFSSGLSAGLNGSGFTNGYADGGLLSAHLGWYLAGGHMLDLSYGHSLYRVIESEEDRTTRWLRFLGRAHLSRRFYVLGDLEYSAGDDLEGPRVFLELGVLF